MTYKELNQALENLGDGEMLEFTFNTEFYKFNKFIFGNNKASYSVRQNYTSMAVDKISNRFVSLYTYDMMSQQTKFKMLIEAIELA
tara:strand:+ start:1868 stop:2125 length:258 start_codon:yes stop_codon:yes gene_type:complete